MIIRWEKEKLFVLKNPEDFVIEFAEISRKFTTDGKREVFEINIDGSMASWKDCYSGITYRKNPKQLKSYFSTWFGTKGRTRAKWRKVTA